MNIVMIRYVVYGKIIIDTIKCSDGTIVENIFPDIGAEINPDSDRGLQLIDSYPWKNNLCAVNLSSEHISMIKQYYPEIETAVGDACKLPWPDKYFDILVSSNDITHPKPHPETFLKCAQLLGVEPSICEVFEDADLGIQAAKSAGMMSTLVTSYYDVTIGQEI